MSYCPKGAGLCDTLQDEAAKCWNFLTDSHWYDLPIREDTITQNMCLELARKHRDCVTFDPIKTTYKNGKSKPFSEKDSGSDFILGVRYPDSRNLVFAVQAKRLYPSRKYDHFKEKQRKTLVSFAEQNKLNPLYLFYNGVMWDLGTDKNLLEMLSEVCILRVCRGMPPAPQVVNGMVALDARKMGAADAGKKGEPLKLALPANQFPFWSLFCSCDLSKDFPELTAPETAKDTLFSKWLDGSGVSGEKLGAELIGEENSDEEGSGEGFHPSFAMRVDLTKEKAA